MKKNKKRNIRAMSTKKSREVTSKPEEKKSPTQLFLELLELETEEKWEDYDEEKKKRIREKELEYEKCMDEYIKEHFDPIRELYYDCMQSIPASERI